MARSFLAATLALIVGLSLIGGSLAQETTTADTDVAREQALVASAVDDIFALAAARDYTALYDSMHPDSLTAISRTVALNLFNDVYARILVDQSQIVGMDFGSWTWEVNGVTYPEAVAVSVVQQVLDENNKPSWVQESIYLAKQDGTWRWFISPSKDFVDQVNEVYADAPPVDESTTASSNVPQVTTLSDVPRDQVFQVIVDDLDEFYRDVLSYTDVTYESPGVVVVPDGETVQSACGPASTGFYGFYCPLDATMYLDEPFLLNMVDEGNAFAAAFVIAHEWAHHVQTGLGFERTSQPGSWNQVHSIDLELMADCFSGVWARDAELRGLVDPGDIETAINDLVFGLGDPKFIGEFDPQAHGNGEQRVRATLNGYENRLHQLQPEYLGLNIREKRPTTEQAALTRRQVIAPAAVALGATAFHSLAAGAQGDGSSGPNDQFGGDYLLPANRILAYYGYPGNELMGILGEHDMETLLAILRDQAVEYEAADSSRPWLLAFEVIASVAQRDAGPDGMFIAYAEPETIQQYVDFTAENDLLLILDVQFGRKTVAQEIDAVRPWLAYPHVHLAIDPEFAIKEGETPGVDLGQIDAADVLLAQELLADIARTEGLPPKLLIVHQFNLYSLTNRDQVGQVPGAQFVLEVDGWGGPEAKRETYAVVGGNVLHDFYGFKLWYRQDEPLMTAAEVMSLQPPPDVVIYQ